MAPARLHRRDERRAARPRGATATSSAPPRRSWARCTTSGTSRKPRLVAVADDEHDAPDPDRVLGYAMVNLPLQDNTHTAGVEIGVRPAQRRQGVGSSLYDAVLTLVRDAGRTTVTASTRPAGRAARGPGHARRDDRRRPRRGRRRRFTLPAEARLRAGAGRALLRVRPARSTRTSSRSTVPRPRRTPGPTTAWSPGRATRRRSGSTSTRC